MKLLLDTHLLLRIAGQSDRLSEQARSLIEAPQNELIFSVASLWEVDIKRAWVERTSRSMLACCVGDCSTMATMSYRSRANTSLPSITCRSFTRIPSTGFFSHNHRLKGSRSSRLIQPLLTMQAPCDWFDGMGGPPRTAPHKSAAANCVCVAGSHRGIRSD